MPFFFSSCRRETDGTRFKIFIFTFSSFFNSKTDNYRTHGGMAHNNGCNNIASPQSEQSAEEHITNHSPKEKRGKGEFAFEKALLGEGGERIRETACLGWLESYVCFRDATNVCLTQKRWNNPNVYEKTYGKAGVRLNVFLWTKWQPFLCGDFACGTSS